jgi:2-polyprenyl-3-methyl-5-hydroxy-6-metoxy-1,4-benzoquinol methylase
MGVSKFEFIVRPNLPDLQGKRILELGCNAGVVSIHMARLGAAEVVGIDCERGWAGWREQAAFVKGALEWRCRTSYNVRFIECDMRRLPDLDLGKFDICIALNCIYYIEKEEIRKLPRHIASVSDLFLVQCNTRDHSHLGRRTGPRFIQEALQANGFPAARVDWPWDRPRKGFWPQRYSRPVVVGTKA